MASDPIAPAVRALEKSIEIFEPRVPAALPSPFLKPNSKLLRKLRTLPGSLADGKARLAAGTALIHLLIELFVRFSCTGKPRFFLITFCWDEGRIPLDATGVPKLKAMKHKIYKAVASIGLDAIGVMELAPFRKSKLHEAFLYLHGHLIGWTFDPEFKPNKAAAALMQGSVFKNELGLPSVTIRSRRKAANVFQGGRGSADHLFADLENDQTEASLAWLAQYIFQAPSHVKHAYRDKKADGKVKLRRSTENYTHSLAIAAQRIMNTIPVPDAVFGVGEGKLIRREWKKRYRAAVGERFSPETFEMARNRRRLAKKALGRRRKARLLKQLQRDSRELSDVGASDRIL